MVKNINLVATATSPQGTCTYKTCYCLKKKKKKWHMRKNVTAYVTSNRLNLLIMLKENHILFHHKKQSQETWELLSFKDRPSSSPPNNLVVTTQWATCLYISDLQLHCKYTQMRKLRLQKCNRLPRVCILKEHSASKWDIYSHAVQSHSVLYIHSKNTEICWSYFEGFLTVWCPVVCYLVKKRTTEQTHFMYMKACIIAPPKKRKS